MSAERQSGRLITVEGIEGVGKSTNMEFIAGFLRQAGRSVVVTREPGGTGTAEKIREVLLASEQGALPDNAELLLMFAARACHLAELIKPALQRGEWVVCDRFTDATYAYQGAGRGLPMSDIAWLENFVQDGLVPDLSLLLDASWQTVDERRSRRGGSDRFELESAAFFARVRAGYQAIARHDPDRVRLIDASQPLDRVQQQIAEELQTLVEKQD